MPRPIAASIKSAADCRTPSVHPARPVALHSGPGGARRARRAAFGLIVLLYLSALAAPAAADDAAMLPLLQGEFALQEGDHDAAAAAYLQAAMASDDPAVAERAARIALLVNDLDLAMAAVVRWEALAPGAAEQNALRAMLALRSGNTDQAATALLALLAETGGWRQALQVVAAQDPGLVNATLLGTLLDSPQWPAGLDPLLALGALAARQDVAALAERAAERATAEFPQEPRAWLWRAEVERRRDNTGAARTSIDTALGLPGLDTPLRLSAATQLDALGDPTAAAAVLAAGEQSDVTLAGRAAYLARAEATDALQALYDEIRSTEPPHSPERHFLLGQVAEVRDDIDAALGWYAAIEEGPMHEQAQMRIAILHDRSDRLDEALATLHRLQLSDSDDGEALINAHLLESELLRKRGRAADGLAAIDRGLAVFDDDPQLLYARALALERMDRVDDAVADLRRLLALDPDNADALNALGYTLADRTGHYEEAHALIERANQLKPDNPAILDSLGWVLHKLGRSNEALLYLRRSFSMQPDAEVAAHLGEVLWLQGERDEARTVWQQGSEIDAENPALVRTLERYGA
jgi:tetratricopeptide (TPR) repeat protein